MTDTVAADDLDSFDRQLLNLLQHGLPLVRHPWEEVARRLDASPQQIRERVQALLDDGVLTRFGPMFDIETLGGAFTLAAMSVSESRFDTVAALLDSLPEVAHNYRRNHSWNMWFVVACDSPAALEKTLAHIETATGLPVLNLPKEETYHVGLHFQL